MHNDNPKLLSASSWKQIGAMAQETPEIDGQLKE
jgi:hypothetical protein